jgi:dTDP-4-dehydrorhamnose reductase
MRLLVTGRDGQVARALRAKAGASLEMIALGRPELDLAAPAALAAVVARVKPDVVVNAAAYTMVDKAEEEEALAMTINGDAAGALARAAAELNVPIVQISTDYVFDGTKAGAYVESDPVAPINAYGRSKLGGERAVAAGNPRHAILRTSWVYDGWGKNFLKTMLRLAETRDELGVVADQIGAPSYAPDIAEAVIAVARNLVDDADARRAGVFHMTGGGETSWAGFAREIFRLSTAQGGPSAWVREIATADYPTPAKRPANSRLNCDALARVHGARMPDWRDALQRCMTDMKKGEP